MFPYLLDTRGGGDKRSTHCPITSPHVIRYTPLVYYWLRSTSVMCLLVIDDTLQGHWTSPGLEGFTSENCEYLFCVGVWVSMSWRLAMAPVGCCASFPTPSYPQHQMADGTYSLHPQVPGAAGTREVPAAPTTTCCKTRADSKGGWIEDTLENCEFLVAWYGL